MLMRMRRLLKRCLNHWKVFGVLHLAVDGLKVLPDAICDLRHLGYLSIHHQLPSSFCKLYHPQVLVSTQSGNQHVLGLNHLISLRHLIPCIYYENIVGIGTLTSLQELSFPANVYKMRELKDLKELQELKIDGLKNDKHHEEVGMIQLHGIKKTPQVKVGMVS
ncbi:uncharacterized protein A4U43_C06F6030 [Asparagus officinalis]|uniref:Uncharacterized protein n=1 Tax=Asparagus officinalis TaxID=4686 RepID=A0A5P1EK55_ASPOF|nr:uncharacterized protein A4U43_C06F6030 [Asparagus officinalis]